MKKVFGLCHKRGSVILVVVCVLVALMILLASFFKSTTSRVHTTKKLGDTMLARELAYSLAVLSNHYLKNTELPEEEKAKDRAQILQALDKIVSVLKFIFVISSK